MLYEGYYAKVYVAVGNSKRFSGFVINSKYNLYKPNTNAEKTKTLTDAIWMITYDQLMGNNFINQ